MLAALRNLCSAIYYGLDNWYWAQKMDLFQAADTAKVGTVLCPCVFLMHVQVNRMRIAFWLASVALGIHPAVKAYLAGVHFGVFSCCSRH